MASPDLIIKQHDTFPPLKATLSDENGPIDLTEATEVKLLMKTGSTLVEGKCTISKATEGKIEYEWGAEDTKTPGEYKLELEIIWNSGKKESVPNAGTKLVLIEADLG